MARDERTNEGVPRGPRGPKNWAVGKNKIQEISHLLSVLEVREGDNNRPAKQEISPKRGKLEKTNVEERKKVKKTTCSQRPPDQCASWQHL